MDLVKLESLLSLYSSKDLQRLLDSQDKKIYFCAMSILFDRSMYEKTGSLDF